MPSSQYTIIVSQSGSGQWFGSVEAWSCKKDAVKSMKSYRVMMSRENAWMISKTKAKILRRRVHDDGLVSETEVVI